jgi:aspartate/methionine/tyrosine aminotransferase
MPMPPTFKLERFFAKYEFSGVDSLCSSDCETMSVGELLELEPDAADQFRALRLDYPEPPGSAETRALLSDLYDDNDVTPDDVIVFPSGVEPLLAAFQAVLLPGDRVIIQTPIYGAAHGITQWLGCTATDWPMLEDDSAGEWRVDLDQLDRLLAGGAKLLYMNSPHNPTGWQASHEEFQLIADLCARHDAIFFSDEAYRQSEYNAEDLLPGGCELGDYCISLGVLSKGYGLPGLRIGWIATTNESLRDRISRIKDYTSIATSSPSEFLARLALRNQEAILNRLKTLIVSNLEAVDRFMVEHSGLLSWSRPKAGPIGFVRVRDGVSADRLTNDVRENANALLLPSSVYNWGDQHFRIGFGRADCRDVLARVAQMLREYD